jgi:hypothetical protein
MLLLRVPYGGLLAAGVRLARLAACSAKRL